jgi:hypothetical protein
MFNKMFKEVEPNLVIYISSVAHIDHGLRIKSIVEPVIHSSPPVDNDMKRNRIVSCRD